MATNKDYHRILVIGALGQIGSELTSALKEKYGPDRVIATDIREPRIKQDHFFILDVLNKADLEEFVHKHKIGIIYNLAAILSAKGEQNPSLAWEINMTSLLNTLDVAKETPVYKVFWPSSIAVFGPNSPKDNTPQNCYMDPNTVYGISKLAGERWCAYYHEKYGVDVRSLRYPGLIGYQSPPGGGTTDYAVDIFHQALGKGTYTCFLREDTALPMMYMEDAIRATISIMEAPAENIRIRSSYNLAGFSFTPAQLVAEIQRFLPEFTCDYEPDFRQKIADSWPSSIDDRETCEDWGWKMNYNLQTMAEDMIVHIREQQAQELVK